MRATSTTTTDRPRGTWLGVSDAVRAVDAVFFFVDPLSAMVLARGVDETRRNEARSGGGGEKIQVSKRGPNAAL